MHFFWDTSFVHWPVAIMYHLPCFYCWYSYCSLFKTMEAAWVQNLFDIVWALDSLRNAPLHPLGDVMILKNILCCLFHGYIWNSLTCIVTCTDGNGFKTSTMRLGADAIVFTCAKDHRYFLICIFNSWHQQTHLTR